jgi:hypothetical protein
VYIVNRNPTGSTSSQKPRLLVEPPNAPLLLIRSPNTKPRSWCWSGTKISSPITIATPIRCQPTETLFISARKRSAKMFTTVYRTRIKKNSSHVSDRMCALSPKSTPNTFSA